jgi:hypothetical protein
MDLHGKSSEEWKIYQIKIDGKLNEKCIRWLNGTIINNQESSNYTTILIRVPDQAALRGVLNKLWDLNLVFHSIQQIDPKPNAKFE